MSNDFEKNKFETITNETIMRNRYLTRFIALLSFFIVIVFISIFIYDKFVVNHSCFTFYLEVSDRNVHERVLTDAEVRDRINQVCIKYNTGYTIWVGQGGYVDENKNVQTNDTYILRINNLDSVLAKNIARDFIKSVNSSACMVEENRSKADLIFINE